MEALDYKLGLSRWNLPKCVLQQYAKNGLTSMFQWQAECLSIDGVLDGRNLVYAAPTSAGKTLVVEILLLKRVLETGKKAIFVLPFVSVAREKLFHMRNLFEETGIRVDGYMGGHAPTNGFSSVDVAVCTIEKANGLINRLIEEKTIDQIGMLVVDELHMVGDEGRGYILELLLTKIRFMEKCRPVGNEKTGKNSIQIVGMSATLPNLDLLADWLDAALYVTDFRPVPLQRCLKVGPVIYDDSLTKMRDFVPSFSHKKDEDNIATLCYETLSEGNSVLVFCPTKNWCEKMADSIAHQFYDLNSEHQKDQSKPFVKLHLDDIKDIFEQLCRCPVGVDAILNRSLPLGVAYHHAGLTTEERDIVESGFRVGAIRVLVATSTLSSGVNLPARRVIIRTPVFNRKTLDVRTYLQMTGRAGRKGVDDKGESILVCRQNEHTRGKTLLTSKPLPIKSCLVQANNEELTTSLKRAILEIIVNGIASTYGAVQAYTNCTLLSAQMRAQKPQVVSGPMTRRRSLSSPVVKKQQAFSQDVIESCIKWLVDHEFVLLQKNESAYNDASEDKERLIVATQLGRAALLSSLPTGDALTVLADLHQAMKALALDTELHLIYLVTPIFCYNEWTGLDWYQYLNVYESMSNSHKSAASLIGVGEQFLTRMAAGASTGMGRGRQSEKMQRLLGTHRRFYAALALHDLVQEVPLPKVCSKYSCNRGMLQQLQQSAASFAGMVTTFCQELGWWSLELLLREFQTRLAFGVQRELMDLMQISLLNNQRARALYAAGLTSCQLVAQTSPVDVELVLRNSTHFQTARKAVNESDWEAEERKKQRNIFVTGKKGLTEYEAAVLVVDEAKKICGKDNDNSKKSDIELCTEKNAAAKGQEIPNNHATNLFQSVPKVQKNEPENTEACHAVVQAEPQCEEPSCSDVVCGPIAAVNNSSEINDNKLLSVLRIKRDDLLSEYNRMDVGHTVNPNPATDSGCGSKESSLTETQMKLVLDDDSMETSFLQDVGGNTGADYGSLEFPNSPCGHLKNTTDISNIVATDEAGSNDSLRNTTENSIQELLFGSTSSGVDSPITLILDGSSSISEEASAPSLPFVSPDAQKPLLSSHYDRNDEFEEAHPQAAKTAAITATTSNHISDEAAGRSSANKTSLTDSQLNAMLGDSFTQDLLDEIHSKPQIQSARDRMRPVTSNKDDGLTPAGPLQTVADASISPGTLKAMDVSFSPCIMEREKENKSDQTRDHGAKQSTNHCVPATNRFSTPKHAADDKNIPAKPFSQYFPSSGSRDVGQSPFLSLGQPCNRSGKTPSSYAGDAVCSEEVSSPIVDSVDNSLEDLFGPTEDLKIKKNSFFSDLSAPSLSPESLAELDCALNISDVSSDFSVDATRASANDIGHVHSSEKNCEESLSLAMRKRKSPDQECSVNKSQHSKRTTGTHVSEGDALMQTPQNYLTNDAFDDAELILSSQKDEDRALSAKKRRENYSINRCPMSKPDSVSKSRKKIFQAGCETDEHLKDVTSQPACDGMICSSQTTVSLQPKSQRVTPSQSGLTIIDVCCDPELFATFMKEWATKKHFSFAVAARSVKQKATPQIMLPKIGQVAEDDVTESSDQKVITHVVVGVAICWGQQDAYFISLKKSGDCSLGEGDYEEEFSCLDPPSLAEDLSVEKRVRSIKSIAKDLRSKSCVSIAFDIKKQTKILLEHMGVFLDANWQDPGVASWMLDPSENEKTLIHLVNQFIPEDMHLLTGLNKCSNYGSISCSRQNDCHAPARIRACVESVCSYRLMKKLSDELADAKMWDMFSKVEMPHIKCLAIMELNGIGFDAKSCSLRISELHEVMRQLEKQAHKLAKKQFSLASPNEVAQVLFGDLGLPPEGKEKETMSVDLRKVALGVGRSAAWRKGRNRKIPQSWSTKKEVLEKLMHLHPLPGVILNWRQISFTLSKSVHPFSHAHTPCDQSGMQRVHSCCITQSVTGRVSIAEPNIQNVPKSYQVKVPPNSAKVGKSGVYDVNVRSLFIPSKGYLLLAADYSQLELRIFAHLSKDQKLLGILNSDAGDIFKMIAAQWKEIRVDDVTDTERQRAKQICYGMLYGIGPKALSQQLNIDEKAAEQFMESFMRSFPGVRSYIRVIIQRCCEKGYIETLCGRRRYLPSIKDSNMAVRSQAERQAVNSTIQGSAADLVKKATVKLHRQLEKKWNVLLRKNCQDGPSGRWRQREPIAGCYFVLHLHDELMFEVDRRILAQVALDVKTCLEQATGLKVKLPVKLKAGKSWGRLADYVVKRRHD